MSIFADSKAIGAIVTFAPPAIEDAEIEAAMAAGFHPAGARGLQRTARGVKPNITTRNHLPRHVHVVILDENQVPLQIAVFAQVNDMLDVTLAIVVARVRLAGENELHGPALIAGEFYNVFQLLEYERRTFISGKSAGKADGQRVGIEQGIESNEITMGQALALEEQPPPREFDQFAPQVVTQRPKFLVGNKVRVGHSFPKFG